MKQKTLKGLSIYYVDLWIVNVQIGVVIGEGYAVLKIPSFLPDLRYLTSAQREPWFCFRGQVDLFASERWAIWTATQASINEMQVRRTPSFHSTKFQVIAVTSHCTNAILQRPFSFGQCPGRSPSSFLSSLRWRIRRSQLRRWRPLQASQFTRLGALCCLPFFREEFWAVSIRCSRTTAVCTYRSCRLGCPPWYWLR